MSKTIDQLPSLSVEKALEECTTGELLSHVGRLALLRAIELMTAPIGDHLDTREMRRVEVGGNIGIKTMARVQVALMQAQAGEQRMIEYEAAVARQEKLLGLHSLPKDGKARAKKAAPKVQDSMPESISSNQLSATPPRRSGGS